ncbi:MAG: hypothetical protein HYW05_02480 [Candidatus Diapherotrites archaeon]|nr:hypothetical protein [Candidatus Diapherotrites archaeon]
MPGNKPPRSRRVKIGGKLYKKLNPEDLLYGEGVPKSILLSLARKRSTILGTNDEVFLGYAIGTGVNYYARKVIDDEGNPRISMIAKIIKK